MDNAANAVKLLLCVGAEGGAGGPMLLLVLLLVVMALTVCGAPPAPITADAAGCGRHWRGKARRHNKHCLAVASVAVLPSALVRCGHLWWTAVWLGSLMLWLGGSSVGLFGRERWRRREALHCSIIINRVLSLLCCLASNSASLGAPEGCLEVRISAVFSAVPSSLSVAVAKVLTDFLLIPTLAAASCRSSGCAVAFVAIVAIVRGQCAPVRTVAIIAPIISLPPSLRWEGRKSAATAARRRRMGGGGVHIVMDIVAVIIVPSAVTIYIAVAILVVARRSRAGRGSA